MKRRWSVLWASAFCSSVSTFTCGCSSRSATLLRFLWLAKAWSLCLSPGFSGYSLPLTFISGSFSCLCPLSSLWVGLCWTQGLGVQGLTISSFLLFTGKDMLCEKVTQSSPDKIVESGSEVTLPCTYDSIYEDPDLYWYRIRPDHSFQFILYRDNARVLDADFTQGRFSVQRSRTHETFNLVISSVRTEDIATYYCAISPHGDAGAQEVCT